LRFPGPLRSTQTFLLTFFFTGVLFAVPGAMAQSAKYTGPGSCSSSSCHGGVQPRTDNSVLQNEYSVWAVQDQHARAFSGLTGDPGKRIGRNLNLQPATSNRCVGCHTLDVPEEDKARSFDSNEGVSCESCHGGASNWLGPHTARDGSYQKSLTLGMYDTRDLIKRNEKCLSCHLGDATKTVDHEMIAAGHPDLYFEIESFEAVQPRHWKEPFPKDAAIELRGLAVGQAVQLREWMRRIGRDSAHAWPEYADLDCIACHHSLTAPKDSWRQERGYAGHKAGNPPWNSSRFAVLETIARQLDAAEAANLDRSVARVNQLVSDVQADRSQIATAAAAAANSADQLAHNLAGMNLDPASALKLIQGICGDADRISAQGERSAEQAAMAVNSLFVSYVQGRKPGNDAAVRASIGNLYKHFENPSAWNPEPFTRALREVGTLIGGQS
jgi:hypothetical protein